MKKLTKQEALDKIEELKKYIDKKEEKGIIIYRIDDTVLFESTKQTVKEAVEEADLSGANLYKADLSEANLYEASLSGANLSGANLIKTDLRGANLYKADLSGAYLSGANLRGANLRGADLYEADLSEAHLYEANFENTELQNAKFYGKGGTAKITKEQVPLFLKAFGFIVE